jgi:omega-hydroxy-beta-dihydromenaquinone-9 sulfotransferase
MGLGESTKQMTDNNKIIFIVGNSRSGTTMMGRIFGSHSNVHAFDELHFFEHEVDVSAMKNQTSWSKDRLLSLLERLLTTEREYRHFFADVEEGKYRNDAEKILSMAKSESPVAVYQSFLNYETINNGKIIPCEQTPRYLFFAQEILDKFPGAIVINMIRDPRDVLLSQKNKWRRRQIDSKRTPLIETIRTWVNYHPYTITKLWVAAVRTANRLEVNPRFTSIKFEDLLQQPEKVMRKLSEFAGIEFEHEMLNVSQIGSSTGKDKPENKGVDSSRHGVWRKGGLTDVELAICQSVADQEMTGLGHLIEPVDVSGWRRWMSMFGFGFKITLALLLNLHRTKNLFETIRRRILA